MKNDKLIYLLVLLVVITLPFNLPGTYSVLPVTALIFFSAMYYKGQRFILQEAKFLSSLFFIYLIWSIPVLFQTWSFSFFELALPFFVFPLILSKTRIDHRQFRTVILSYIGAVLVSYFASLFAAVYHFYNTPPRWGRASDFFFHVQFTEGLLNIHPTYYSLMGCVATLFTMFSLKGWKRWLIILLLTIFIFMVNARITIIIHTVIVLVFLSMELFQKYRWKSAVIVIMLCAGLYALSGVFSTIYDYPHRKIAVDLEAAWDRSDDPDISDAEGGLITRLAIWRNALETIKERFWLGYGFPNEKLALMTSARNNHAPEFILENASAFNSHNQILSYAVNFGFIGSLLILAYFSFLARYIYQQRNWLALSFLLIFLICGFTESVLERMWGVVLFAFFNSFLLLKPDNQNE